MSSSTIDLLRFKGMNNIKAAEGFADSKGVIEPRVILNADVDINGRLVKRTGATLATTLAGAHSLWAGANCMLCVAAGKLYKVNQGVATELSSVDGPGCKLFYAEVGNKVYMSNPYWKGVYDSSAGTVSSWGISQPNGPMLFATVGNLPAGTYYVCMTNTSSDGDEISGNSPISSITLTSTGGIQVANWTSEIVWVTDTNEHVFYRVGTVGTIVDVPTSEPLTTFLCSPPPLLENLCYAFGRIWGSVGKSVYYSQPYQLSLFKLTMNRFEFHSNVTVIAAVDTGMFFGCENGTLFYKGTRPEEMEQIHAGAGSIKGTLAYCNNLPELGDILGTPEKGYVDVPVWLTKEGIVAGSTSGKLYNLTKNKVKMSVPESGAALYRNLQGVLQFLVSFKRGVAESGVGSSDAETLQVLEDGAVSQHEHDNKGTGSISSFADVVTCTVTRNGEEV